MSVRFAEGETKVASACTGLPICHSVSAFPDTISLSFSRTLPHSVCFSFRVSRGAVPPWMPTPIPVSKSPIQTGLHEPSPHAQTAVFCSIATQLPHRHDSPIKSDDERRIVDKKGPVITSTQGEGKSGGLLVRTAISIGVALSIVPGISKVTVNTHPEKWEHPKMAQRMADY